MVDDLDLIRGELLDAVRDPAGWQKALDSINRFVSGSGLVLLSVDERLRRAPCSTDLAEMIDDYFRNGWHSIDCREGCRSLLLQNGVVFDHEFQDVSELENTDYHQDFLGRHGRKWFAGIAAKSGDDLWCLALQRSSAKGPFDNNDRSRLQEVQKLLSGAVVLADLISLGWLRGTVDALELQRSAAVVLDYQDCILAMNESARTILKSFIDRSGRIYLADRRYAGALAQLQKETTPSRLRFAVSIERDEYLFEAITIRNEPSTAISRAATLLLISRSQPETSAILQRRFGLTPSESRVALALAGGSSVAEIAHASKVSLNTVRSQLKSIYAKTQAGSQSKLVSLIFNLRGDCSTDL